MTIKELKEKRAKAWDDAREFLDSKRNDSGLLSEEDSKTYDTMEQQIVAYGKEIDRLERQEKLGREMNAATSVPLVSAPGAHRPRWSRDRNHQHAAARADDAQLPRPYQRRVRLHHHRLLAFPRAHHRQLAHRRRLGDNTRTMPILRIGRPRQTIKHHQDSAVAVQPEPRH